MVNPSIIDGPNQPPLQHEKGGWLGPLFYWEIIREARKGRSYLPRMVYTSGLLLLLYLLMRGNAITLKGASRFGEEAFNYYLVFQYLAVLLLTPVYVAGTFIEDRQQGTLPLLMTTFLTPRELVVGKMMGRLVPMLGVLLAGVPVLALLQFFGGISFGTLVFQTINALILLLIVGMHSIRCSTLYGTVGAAVFYTYFRILGAFLLCYILSLFIVFVFQVHDNRYAIMFYSVVFQAINLMLGWISLRGAMRAMSVRRRGEDRTLPEREQQKVRSPVVLAEMKPAHTETDPEPPPEPGHVRPMSVTEVVQELHMRGRNTEVTPWNIPPVFTHWAIVWKQTFYPDRSNLITSTVILCIAVFVFMIGISTERDFQSGAVWPSYYWTLWILMAIVLYIAMLHTAGSLATERTHRTLIHLVAAPISIPRLVLEFGWGSLWRYRWLLGMLVSLLLISVFISQSAALIWYLLIFSSQLACYTMLALTISMIAQTPWQARMMVSVILFMNLLVLPGILRSWPWVARELVVPIAAWEMVPIMLTKNRSEFALQLLGVCLILWFIAIMLFLITCKLLQRWMQRA